MAYTYELIPGGYRISQNGTVVCTQDSRPGDEGYCPMSPEESVQLAEAKILELERADAPKPKPTLIVSHVSVDEAGTNIYMPDGSANIPLGSDVLIKGWLEYFGQRVPLVATFRVPVVKQSRSGEVISESLGLASFDGESGMRATWKARELGKWMVLEDEINRDLPVENRMSFCGLTLYVF